MAGAGHCSTGLQPFAIQVQACCQSRSAAVLSLYVLVTTVCWKLHLSFMSVRVHVSGLVPEGKLQLKIEGVFSCET